MGKHSKFDVVGCSNGLIMVFDCTGKQVPGLGGQRSLWRWLRIWFSLKNLPKEKGE
jgi:hypothetical protein